MANFDSKAKSIHDILIKPIVSEKTYGRIDLGKYPFEVQPTATKPLIKQAVQEIFGVHVTGVNTMNRKGKALRTRFGTGKRKDIKIAIVSIKEGESIDVFGASN
jgi:large subunit ribosomal protein L23